MLTSFDDYPIHQSSTPIADTATADLNHYDRYFFNGYTGAGTGTDGDTDAGDNGLYFALAMGLYPNRAVTDAAFSVVRSSVQSSVFASARAPLDRAHATTVGPIRIEVVEPLHVLRLVVDAVEHGVRADLRFERRSMPIEEPPFILRAGIRTVFDFTRMTQFGTWTGWVEVEGERIDLEPVVAGSRDRSWGIRPVGEQVPAGAPSLGAPQFFWLWAPVSFGSFATHFDVNEHADGRRWHEAGYIVGDGAEPETMRAVDWRVQWRPGTRWTDRFEYDLVGWDERVSTVRLEPIYEFQMSGVGYSHPEWAHGVWKGESATAGQRLELPVDDPCDRSNVHVQALCTATFIGADGTIDHGMGTLEQLAVGPHPSGLTGILDGYVALG